MRTSLPVLFVACALVAGPASAEMIKYTDSQGRLHFTQDISQVPPEYRHQVQKQELGREISVTGEGGGAQGQDDRVRAEAELRSAVATQLDGDIPGAAEALDSIAVRETGHVEERILRRPSAQQPVVASFVEAKVRVARALVRAQPVETLGHLFTDRIPDLVH